MKKGNSDTIDRVPGEQIDTSDIPETIDWTGAVRGLFARPETRHISIRLNAADLILASRLAGMKGLPYQTYIKSLLHEALVAESRKLPGAAGPDAK